ncbi:hypothetical protein [Sorangium sp. So ce693]|uniref:hypothetical protein n=1 Tax=Sorangium sp. So ce693 TaxID=3133318 RepID=UPI003F63F812
MNLGDPRHRMRVTFPGKPATRCVSPHDIETYLESSGYHSALLEERDWPRDIPYAWLPPSWPDPRAPPIRIQPHIVRRPRLCSQPMEKVIEIIAHNEGRAPGEVLREMAVHSQLENGEQLPPPRHHDAHRALSSGGNPP